MQDLLHLLKSHVMLASFCGSLIMGDYLLGYQIPVCLL